MRRLTRRRLGAGIALLVAVVAAALVTEVSSAAPGATKIQGKFFLSQEAGTGVATGTLSGTVLLTNVYQDYTSRPNALRFADDLVITRRDGSVIQLTMEYLATNFTSDALMGGGIAFQTNPVDTGETYYNLTVTMSPGTNYPEQVWTYSGHAGVAG